MKATTVLTVLTVVVLTVLCHLEASRALDIRMDVNVNISGGKKHVSITHRPETGKHVDMQLDETPNYSKPQQTVSREIANESRDVIKTAKNIISKSDETVIAEKYLLFASKLQEIYNQLPDNDKTSNLKKLLAQYIQLFSKRSAHPASDILKGSLKDIAMNSENSNSASGQLGPNGPVSIEETSGGAETMFKGLGSIISSQIGRITNQIIGQVSGQIGGQLGQMLDGGQTGGGGASTFTPEKIKEIMDKFGSYAGGVNLMGVQLGGNIAETLERLGFPQSSQIASLLGKSITKFSQSKLAPLEATVKSSVMPRVVKSATPITESIGLLTGSISKSSAFKKVSLPPKYQEMKGSLKSVISQLSKKIRNAPNGSVNNTKPMRVPAGNRGNRNRPSQPSIINGPKPRNNARAHKPLRLSNNRPSPSPRNTRKTTGAGAVNHVRPVTHASSSRVSNPAPRAARPPPVVHRAAVVHRTAAPVSARRR